MCHENKVHLISGRTNVQSQLTVDTHIDFAIWTLAQRLRCTDKSYQFDCDAIAQQQSMQPFMQLEPHADGKARQKVTPLCQQHA